MAPAHSTESRMTGQTHDLSGPTDRGEHKRRCVRQPASYLESSDSETEPEDHKDTAELWAESDVDDGPEFLTSEEDLKDELTKVEAECCRLRAQNIKMKADLREAERRVQRYKHLHSEWLALRRELEEARSLIPTCCICMNDLSTGEVTLACGHRIHGRCMQSYLSTRHGRAPCPICRRLVL